MRAGTNRELEAALRAGIAEALLEGVTDQGELADLMVLANLVPGNISRNAQLCMIQRRVAEIKRSLPAQIVSETEYEIARLELIERAERIHSLATGAGQYGIALKAAAVAARAKGFNLVLHEARQIPDPVKPKLSENERAFMAGLSPELLREYVLFCEGRLPRKAIEAKIVREEEEPN